MVKPRMIILVRHAQSEGNKNREIHQMIPDHRVKLTNEGHKQAEEAGRRLRALLKPDDTLQIFTSPYRRTRETTEGILKTLTARSDPDDPSAAPSPFSRSKIKVYEEPRLREQDFGNFQPCSAEMERMWAERADYGHFFYRIPNGESAADAYDRVSGFNESLWRQFGDADFPSVCVLVTHGLMSRIFLMKWYHWSVEYFEDLRNTDHCEFIVMKKDPDTTKYRLENELRTWSELKRQRAQQQQQAPRHDPQRRNTLSSFLKKSADSPTLPPRKWGGCTDGCDHGNERYPRRAEQKKQQTQEELHLPPAATRGSSHPRPAESPARSGARPDRSPTPRSEPRVSLPAHLRRSHDGSGTSTPHEISDEAAAGYFSQQQLLSQPPRSLAHAMHATLPLPQRKATPEDIERWVHESGMGTGRKADALGDEPEHWPEENLSTADETACTDSAQLGESDLDERGVRASVY